MSKRGRLVVVEGLEGAGKSTALASIERFLSTRVVDLVVTREPGGTRAGELIRRLVKDPSLEPLDARAELLLFYAARIQLVECVILPALARGAWVLADRFELSTFAYQAGGRQLDREFIAELSAFSLRGLQPDCTFFLDISPQQGLQRAVLRGQFDRIEQESIDFFNAVYAQYHIEIQRCAHVRVIDASRSLPEVEQEIHDQLVRYYDEQAK